MTHMRNRIGKIRSKGREFKKIYHMGQEIWSSLDVYEKYNSVYGYMWDKSTRTSYTYYQETSRGAGAHYDEYTGTVYGSYSLNQTTGKFSVSGVVSVTESNNGKTIYHMNGAQLRKGYIKIINPDMPEYRRVIANIWQADYYADAKTGYKKGTFIEKVTSATGSTYPTNSYSGSYWYDNRVQEYLKTTLVGTIEAEPNSLPANGRHTDGFWYVLIS